MRKFQGLGAVLITVCVTNVALADPVSRVARTGDGLYVAYGPYVKITGAAAQVDQCQKMALLALVEPSLKFGFETGGDAVVITDPLTPEGQATTVKLQTDWGCELTK